LVYLNVPAGPGVGEEVARVITGGAAGEVIEHVAEMRPRVETVSRRAGANTQQYGSGGPTQQLASAGAFDALLTNENDPNASQ
jgi:hypothetical protein